MNKFFGELDLRAYAPDEWVVLSPFTFAGFLIPRGFITDLASIPRAARSAFDINGISRQPAVLHDFLYSTQPVTRKQADDFFLEALRSCGASKWDQYGLYSGVRVGGWVAWNGHKDDTRADNFVPESYWTTQAA